MKCFVTCVTCAVMAAVGCLPNANVVVWMQTVLYFAAAVLGFFVTIPMGVLLVSLDFDELYSAVQMGS